MRFRAVPTHPTILKLRVLSRNQQLIRWILKKVLLGGTAAIERINQALGSIGALVLRRLRKARWQRAADDCVGA